MLNDIPTNLHLTIIGKFKPTNHMVLIAETVLKDNRVFDTYF